MACRLRLAKNPQQLREKTAEVLSEANALREGRGARGTHEGSARTQVVVEAKAFRGCDCNSITLCF